MAVQSTPVRTLRSPRPRSAADARPTARTHRPAVELVEVSVSGLVYEVPTAGARVFDVLLDGRRVWSFTESDAPLPDGPGRSAVAAGVRRAQPWPPALVPWLRGRFRVGLREVGAAGTAETEVELGGGTGPLDLADRYGRPLVVNKWGRLGHALADAPEGLVERMLDSMDGIREVVQRELGDVVYVTGGTLLGPVRENGRVMPHDDDADLAYLSGHEHPADVTLENFRLGRALRAAGYDVLRLSVGHLQVVRDHDGAPDHYVDVFTGFLLGGRWHQHFPIRAEARREDLLPPSTVTVEGRPEPAPRRPEFMLEQLFGDGWRIPDPSYQFDLPAATSDRFYGWFADYNVEREQWDDVVLLAPDGQQPARGGMSAFARAVHAETPESSAVLELGSGLGADALALARAGRTVRAVDFSRHAVRLAQEAAADLADTDLAGADLDLEVLNLLDSRAVVRLGARLAAEPVAWTVFGRRLLNALEDRGRDNVFRLCSMLLRRGTAAHLDVVTDHGYAGIAPHRHLSVAQVTEEARRHGLDLAEAVPRIEPMTWFDAPQERLVETCRLTFRRRTR
ncbi:class I SAM-dependent methyltransferase [Modestobacter sp. NPDC049651]|uniref:class I SAM-dependent methyltransferase n=1 Tax=unclassified Modestobacter TaxID=2643866 RepID=UPI0033CDB28B